MKLREKIVNFLKSWRFNAMWSDSLEPVILMLFGGWSIVSGAEVGTDMLYRKICEVGMNKSAFECVNLTHFEDLKLNVTKEVNLFTLRGNLFKAILPFLISFVGGTIFDNFPKKIFLITPLLFASLEPIAEILNFNYFYELPVEFMYLTSGAWCLGGGGPMWYMAEYGFISLVASPQNRVGRLSRADASESVAGMVFTPLSAPIFGLIGYCGIHGVKLAMYYAGLIYLFFVIKEPKICQNTKEKKTARYLLKKIALSIVEMTKTVFKKRKGNLRGLILIQMVNSFLLNLMMVGLFHLNYPYVKALFDVTGEQFANFSEIQNISFFLSQFLLVPVISKYFGVSDSLFLIVVTLSSSGGLFLASAANSYTWFCVGRLSIPLFYSTWLLLRSLLVSCIDPDEIGRVFGALAIFLAVAEYISEPLFRGIFSASIDGPFPGLHILVTAILFLLMGLNCIFLHWALSREIRNGNMPQVTVTDEAGTGKGNDNDVD